MEYRLFISLLLHFISMVFALPPPKEIQGNWKSVFEQDFSENDDLSNWDIVRDEPPNARLTPRRFSKIAPGLSYYLPKNVKVDNKNLRLRVERESFSEKGLDYLYTGARVNLKCPIKYGFINIRAKLPKVNAGGRYFIGLNNKDRNQITIMEAINDASFYSHDTKLESTFTGFEYLFTNTNGFTSNDYFPYKPGDFNDFSVHWGFQNVTFYINGKLASFQTLRLGTLLSNALSLKDKAPFPVDEVLTLELSNSVGNWGGYPSSSTVFPFDILIEKVEVYQDQDFKSSYFGCDGNGNNGNGNGNGKKKEKDDDDNDKKEKDKDDDKEKGKGKDKKDDDRRLRFLGDSA